MCNFFEQLGLVFTNPTYLKCKIQLKETAYIVMVGWGSSPHTSGHNVKKKELKVEQESSACLQLRLGPYKFIGDGLE